MEIFAIGDIHGKFYELRKLIERLNISDSCLLVFLGDYIDRGDNSFEVVEYLIELSKKHNCIFLKGNHEGMFMDFLSGIDEQIFMYNGGHNTIESYEDNGYGINVHIGYIHRHLPKSHLNFYRNLKNYYETEDYIFVHAGLLPHNIPLNQQPIETLLWERDPFINSDFDWGKKVVFGHTPNISPIVKKNKIGIDTGACFIDGCLTCVVLPDERFIQQEHLTLEEMV